MNADYIIVLTADDGANVLNLWGFTPRNAAGIAALMAQREGATCVTMTILKPGWEPDGR